MTNALASRSSSGASGPAAGSTKPIDAVMPAFDATEIPRQASAEVERLFRKQRLAASYRLFGQAGFDMGGAGHITARDPEFPDQFWVNPAGVHFSRICVSDLMLVDHAGVIIEPPRKARAILNRAAFAIHSELHKARPDVVAAAHSHSIYGKAWSSLGRLLDPISQDAAAFYEDHGIFTDFSGVVMETSEGERIGQALGSRSAVILQNHGILTVGQSVEAAVWRYFALENACQTQLLAEAAGTVKPMSEAIARLTRSQIGSEVAALWAFNTYWDVVVEAEPDLLD